MLGPHSCPPGSPVLLLNQGQCHAAAAGPNAASLRAAAARATTPEPRICLPKPALYSLARLRHDVPRGRQSDELEPGGPRQPVGSLSVRAIRVFTVRATLPEPLAPLRDLMLNLRWSWHAGTRDLFTALDPAGREGAGRDPITLLGEVPPERLARLAADEDYLGRLDRAAADLREYLSAARWYQRGEQDGTAGARPAAIAYFSPEYGIAAALPQYSGGLGILAGDHLKSGSDLGVPLIGVGLLYRHGYFSQSLSPEGWQLERYPAGDPNGLPLTLLRGSDGAPVTVALALGEGSSLAAQVWLAQVGRVPLLLLDSYVEENDPGLREVTDRLYGGGSEHRLRQELLLGMGGVRAVRAYCELTGLPRPGTDPRVRGPGAELRGSHRTVPGRHGVHHAHPGARRHRPVRQGPGGAAVQRGRGGPGAAVRPGPRPRRGNLPQIGR